jgi:HAD superfamily hydrolase (TIGR01509 family)
MALDGLIFDLDGTLVDTNDAHVEAWRRAFEACGFKVPPDRIAVEIGKGGDFLISAVLGVQAEKEHGERLRQLSMEAFLDVARHQHFRLFPGVHELLRRLRERGLKIALATSSKARHLQATWDSLGLDLTREFDEVITASDIERTKPAPDLVRASLKKMGLFPAQCAMLGDTPYDAQACLQAGVVCLGVRCGGNSTAALRGAGARAVWNDPADLLTHLDEALDLASPGPARWTQELAERLMREALAAAREGLAAGEPPAGCVLVRNDGTVLARGHAEARRRRNRTAHAPLLALSDAADRGRSAERSPVLVCTLEPCVLCTGAAIEVGADAVIFGLPTPLENGVRRVRPYETGEYPLPRAVGAVLEQENRALLQEYLRGCKVPHEQAWARRFLEATR